MYTPQLREIITGALRKCKFDAAAPLPFALLQSECEHFAQWVNSDMDAGPDGGMGYLGRSCEFRGDARRLMPSVQSVVVTLTSYRRAQRQPSDVPRIAAFAWGDDYHDVIKERLNSLLDLIKEQRPTIRGRAVVDSAPTLERAWAVRAGLGWIGRSSMLVNPTLGSYTLIGLLLLDEPLDELADGTESIAPLPLAAHCGSCRRCIDSCPTRAIVADGVIDARRCIAYHTIEASADPDPSLRSSLMHGGDSPRIFGCDGCLDACPYNTTAPPATNMPIRDQVINVTTEQWLEMSDQQFAVRFQGTPLIRSGVDRIRKIISMCYEQK